uniref:Uncharacterized protein n=1 Tax=Mus musculus TaxID=10090 RepID=Q3UY15_MOUSE|nr:unnamed protein product [Mus musculus]
MPLRTLKNQPDCSSESAPRTEGLLGARDGKAVPGFRHQFSHALLSGQQEHTCEKPYFSAETLLHQFQHEEEDPKHQKGAVYIHLSVACPHLIGCSPRASSPRHGMGRDLARKHSRTCAHCLFTN